MKQTLIDITFLLCVALAGCVTEERRAIEGTWRMVSSTMKTADTTISYAEEDLFGIKMIGENRWAVFGQPLRGEDTLAYYGAGTYSLEGRYYTESIDINVVKSRRGKILPFEIEVRNDTLFQDGPPKTPQYAGSTWALREIWVRVK